MTTEQCDPVIYPATPAETRAEIVRDPDQARVVRPPDVPPPGDPNRPPVTPAERVVAGLDLSAYNWRGPEAGVTAGGLWGRWFVSVSGSSTVPGRRIRPVPIRLDAGRPLELVPELNVGVLEAVISVSGSTEAGDELVSESAASPDLIERIAAARTRNPHFSPVGNGRFPVTGSGQPVVGCTIPKIPVNVDGLDRVYREQATPLWRAGIERMDWMFGPTGFRKSDLYSQLNWTLTPGVPAVSGSWVEWPWPYTAVDYNAYRSDVSASLAKWQQPSADLVGEDPLAQNRKRTEGFLREITDIVNRINADSNIIRGLQILGGNVRINQQPRREVRFDAAYVQPRLGGGGGGMIGRDVNTPNIN